MNSKLKLLGREILDLFYPRNCLFSNTLLKPENTYRYWCETLLNQIQWAKDPSCTTCGLSFPGIVQGPHICPNCKDLDPIFSSGKTAFILKGPGRKIIHELKYHKGLHLLPDIIKLIKQLPGYLSYLENAILIPVPLHKHKLKHRGFNQSLVLAQYLSKEAPGSQVIELLKKVKSTQSQTFLKRNERKKNVKNAFALSSKTTINGNLRYILIDDVFTTGATLNACATVLKQNGANNINILTLGHG